MKCIHNVIRKFASRSVSLAITLGFGMGGFMPLRPPIIREYFGTQNFGTIFGLTSIFITIGAVVSPPVTGWVFDKWGAYGPAWLTLGSLAIIGALIMLFLPASSKYETGSQVDN